MEVTNQGRGRQWGKQNAEQQDMGAVLADSWEGMGLGSPRVVSPASRSDSVLQIHSSGTQAAPF